MARSCGEATRWQFPYCGDDIHAVRFSAYFAYCTRLAIFRQVSNNIFSGVASISRQAQALKRTR